MGNIAVRVERLGKMYRIGGKQERYRTLRDSLTDAVSAPFKRARSLLHGQAYGAAGLEETIWALKDVSFEVKHGEVVGIIGRNGAGKSTLLKILSRITEPTEGYADVYGRVGSLLEVGTGFHPELTGRENIYLNGAILGMSRAEIDRKFDEIVDFAEVERFIDTPVKHYSSGMGLRLGFAVAAHLEPEILVVDEVLAVGDAQFQKKCLGKMSAVASEGRTVLFVSHNMAAVKRLCITGLYLDRGQLKQSDHVERICHTYLQDQRRDQKLSDREITVNVEVLNTNGQHITTWDYGEEIVVRIVVMSPREIHGLAIDLAFYAPEQIRVFAIQSDRFLDRQNHVGDIPVTFDFRIRNIGLMVSELFFDIGIRDIYDKYIALFSDVGAISITPPKSAEIQTRANMLINLPSSVRVNK